MNQKNLTIELPNSFQPEIWQRRVAGKSFKKIRYRQDCCLIRAIQVVNKYMHENLNHTVKTRLAKKIKKYFHYQTITTNNRKHVFRDYITQYWHFHRVTPNQYYTLYQASNKTDIFRELLVNNTTHFCKVYIKQYWHFQRVPSKLNYGKNLFQKTYHTVWYNTRYHRIMTLSESYYQTILTYVCMTWAYTH